MGEQFDQKASELLVELRLGERKSVLTTLLGMRFGELPPQARARIEGADAAQVDTCCEAGVLLENCDRTLGVGR